MAKIVNHWTGFWFGFIGDCLIKDMCIVSDDCDCDLIIYGDSITEEQAYFPTEDYNDSWTMLVKENCGKVLISGRGGYSIDSLLVWIQNELTFLVMNIPHK